MLADRLQEQLQQTTSALGILERAGRGTRNLFLEIAPERNLSDLILPDNVHSTVSDLVEEHFRAELLQSYNLEPRHRVLFNWPSR